MDVCETLCHRVATRSNYMREMRPQANLTSAFFIWSHWRSFVEIHSYLLEISHGNISANQRPHDLINMRRSHQWSNLTYTFLQWSRWSIFRWDPFLFTWDIAWKPFSQSEANDLIIMHGFHWNEATNEVLLKSVHSYLSYCTETYQPIRGHAT